MARISKALPVLSSLLALAVVGCSAGEQSAGPQRDISSAEREAADIAARRPQPQARPAKPFDVPASTDWVDWPREPGSWTYRQDARGSLALFGPPGGGALLTVRCDKEEALVVISRAGLAPFGNLMKLHATHGDVSMPARRVDGPLPYMAIGLPAASDMLDNLAYSRGHFAVKLDGLRPVKVPAWPEMARVIEDCRA